jgi:hypothetical protein
MGSHQVAEEAVDMHPNATPQMIVAKHTRARNELSTGNRYPWQVLVNTRILDGRPKRWRKSYEYP